MKQTIRVPVIAGPCVIEDEGLVLETAKELKRQFEGLDIDFYFKASFDKANRTSVESFRGPGIDAGLKILSKVKSEVGVSVLTDFHHPEQALPVAEVADYLQIPAFLCRQTDMILNAVEAAKRFDRKVNVKKGQFLAPGDARNIVEKAASLKSIDGGWFTITERGASFGYNALVVDMSSFGTIQSFGVPVIYDATHSVQVPGAAPGGKTTGGKRECLEVLARAAFAAGADGLFLECHPDPKVAKSDALNAFYLDKVGAFVRQLLDIKKLVSEQPKLLPETQS